MDLTLDEYLRQVDQWKQVVSDRMAKLNPAERAAEDRNALAWLEGMLGRRLQHAHGERASMHGTNERSVS